jgi:drug/metabolite transporter (DMT)-like permease
VHDPRSAPRGPTVKASLLIMTSTLLFALMGVCVKFASALYGAGEIVMYRSIIGLLLMMVALRWRRVDWRTTVPALHLWRSASGTAGLCLWFFAIGALPLATAMTLNYMSSVWMAVFLVASALLFKSSAGQAPKHQHQHKQDWRLVAAILAGFVGVVLVLQPTLAQRQLWAGLLGLLSGLMAAIAYLQVTALGRLGEPGERVVLYFSVCGLVVGAALALAAGPLHAHSLRGAALLLATGVLATFGQWLMTRAYATGATLNIAALQYLGIAYSFGLGVWLFNDPVTPTALLGMLLIVGAGVAATQLRAQTKAALAETSDV